MTNFDNHMGTAVSNAGTKGWLVSILELGAWFGCLCSGYLADRLSRKYTIVLGRSNLFGELERPFLNSCLVAVIVFSIGVVVQTTAYHPASIYAGKFEFGTLP